MFCIVRVVGNKMLPICYYSVLKDAEAHLNMLKSHGIKDLYIHQKWNLKNPELNTTDELIRPRVENIEIVKPGVRQDNIDKVEKKAEQVKIESRPKPQKPLKCYRYLYFVFEPGMTPRITKTPWYLDYDKSFFSVKKEGFHQRGLSISFYAVNDQAADLRFNAILKTIK